jgi:hypothetical protein
MGTPRTVTAKRVIIVYNNYGSNKERYSAATLVGYGGDRIFLATIWGEQTFSRTDGRWIDGPCLNFAEGKIHEFEALEQSIRSGRSTDEYETLLVPPEAPEAPVEKSATIQA